MKHLDPETTEIWISLVSANRLILERVESALKVADLPPLGWYDILFEIEKAGQVGLRPYEIKDRLLLPQYGTSRLLQRLIKARYVSRKDHDSDGRGQIVTITKKGRDTRNAMWPIYASVLQNEIENKLTATEARGLANLLAKFD